MTDSPVNDPNLDDDATAKRRPRPKRPFNPRLAIIYTLGAFVLVLAFAVVMAFVSAGGKSSHSKATTVIDGGAIKLGKDNSTFNASTLPPSGLLTLDGTVTDLSKVAGGKPTMINMFSSSCTACRTEMPALEKLHKALGGQVQIVGVNLGDSKSGTAQFVKQTGVSYEIVRDPNQLLVTTLNITAQPMTLWINTKGRIVGHRYGALTDTEMRLAAKSYLGVEVPSS